MVRTRTPDEEKRFGAGKETWVKSGTSIYSLVCTMTWSLLPSDRETSTPRNYIDRAVWLSGAKPAWAHAVIRDRSGVWADDTGLATLGLSDGTLI
jgi:hypothetical protein